MSDDDSMQIAKDGISLVAEVMKAAGDSPQVKEAARNLGQTAVTLTKTINNFLVPLAAINFAFDKARVYFSGQFQVDLSAKAETIPLEYVMEPKASIAGPTLQGLAFAHEEPNLKEMYLNLLKTSMDRRFAAIAHPAFVEIIKQLDSEDARILHSVLQSASPMPIAQIHRRVGQEGDHVLVQHMLNLSDVTTDAFVEDSQLPTLIDNWARLGLVEVSYEKWLSDHALYSWVEQTREFARLKQLPHAEGEEIGFRRGMLQRTEFGLRFARAIGLVSSEPEPPRESGMLVGISRVVGWA